MYGDHVSVRLVYIKGPSHDRGELVTIGSFILSPHYGAVVNYDGDFGSLMMEFIQAYALWNGLY